jgi:ABC-type antimicrobial peptide transport system permease subunit
MQQFSSLFTNIHLQLNMFWELNLFYLCIVIVVLCLWSGWMARPQTQHNYHHDTKVKSEAATAVIELLMIGGKTPET